MFYICVVCFIQCCFGSYTCVFVCFIHIVIVYFIHVLLHVLHMCCCIFYTCVVVCFIHVLLYVLYILLLYVLYMCCVFYTVLFWVLHMCFCMFYTYCCCMFYTCVVFVLCICCCLFYTCIVLMYVLYMCWERHDIAEILLKLTLNTNQSINQNMWCDKHYTSKSLLSLIFLFWLKYRLRQLCKRNVKY